MGHWMGDAEMWQEGKTTTTEQEVSLVSQHFRGSSCERTSIYITGSSLGQLREQQQRAIP